MGPLCHWQCFNRPGGINSCFLLLDMNGGWGTRLSFTYKEEEEHQQRDDNNSNLSFFHSAWTDFWWLSISACLSLTQFINIQTGAVQGSLVLQRNGGFAFALCKRVKPSEVAGWHGKGKTRPKIGLKWCASCALRPVLSRNDIFIFQIFP